MISINYLKVFISSALILFIALAVNNIQAYPDMKSVTAAASEEKDMEEPTEPKGPSKKKKEYKTIDEFIEEGEFVSMKGFMNILHETEKDKYYLVLDENQLNKEFIYFTYVLNGPSDAGPSGGDMGEAFIFEFRKFKEDIGIYKKR